MEALATCALSVTPKALADALAAVKPAVGTRSVVQALSGVRIVANESGATLYATDFEVTVRRQLDATATGELDLLVSHADLSKAVKLFAKRETVRLEPATRIVKRFDDESTIAAELRKGGTTVIYPMIEHGYGAGTVKPGARGAARDVLAYVDAVLAVAEREPETVDDGRVTDGTRTITLPTLRRDDFPAMDFAPLDVLLAAPAPELADAIGRAVRFASSDETRPILTGVQIDPAEELLVATDSYRLGVIAAPGIGIGQTPRTLRARLLKLAAKRMGKLDGKAIIRADERFAMIEVGEETWRAPLIEGQYPSWRQLMPTADGFDGAGFDVELTVPVVELAGACEVAKAFARHNAPMRLSINGRIEVTGTTPDVADFAELLPGASYTRAADTFVAERNGTEAPQSPPLDEPFVIGLNPDFVADIAAVYRGEEARIGLLSPLRPALFMDGADRYLLMPIRLNV